MNSLRGLLTEYGEVMSMHMIAKGQMKCARGTHPTGADQFYDLAR
jgi:hypothetical protein